MVRSLFGRALDMSRLEYHSIDLTEMTHESFQRNEEVRGSSDRSFGLVFAAVFGLIGLFPLLLGNALRPWSLIIAMAFLVTALLFPRILAPFNRLWLKFGFLLHRIVSPIVLGIMFYLVVTPIGLLMRLVGQDPLRLRFDKGAASYWIERIPPGPAPEDLKNQF